MPRETIHFTIDIDGIGSLDVEAEAVLAWLDGADDPAENGWVCDDVGFGRGWLHGDDGVSRPLGEDGARVLCEWHGRDLDALLEAEGACAVDRLWGCGRGAMREEDELWAAE